MTGMVTGNVDSTTYLDEVEEIEEDGVVRSRTRYKRIISYGVGLLLDDVGGWIDQHIPVE